MLRASGFSLFVLHPQNRYESCLTQDRDRGDKGPRGMSVWMPALMPVDMGWQLTGGWIGHRPFHCLFHQWCDFNLPA
jgi:hypothetical protein